VDIEASKESFKGHLAKQGLRVTNQRLAIFDAAIEAKEHFTAEDLLEYARKIDHTVSRATVYRTLPILTESRLVREIDIGKDYKFYYPAREAQPEQVQVICKDCDRIFEIDAPFLGWYGESAAKKLGLTVESQRLQVTATCDKYKAQGQCPNHR